MTRPLYKDAAQQPARRNADGHAGLWFDKFCDRWGNSWTMPGEQKLEWIKCLANGKVGTSDQIKEYASRLRGLVKKRGGRFELFTTESRFVTGLGRSHPVENGFAWHPTLGTPFLPGSSVKGMVRAWTVMTGSPTDRDMQVRLLGKPDRVGKVCFLDAVPDASVQLEADVMTPHYAGWSECDPPGDWRSPNPIPFLTTAAGTSFLFGFIPTCRGVPESDLDVVQDSLRCALAWAGAGAKTAVGYGRFGRGGASTTPNSQHSPQHPGTQGIPPKPGNRVQAELLEEKTRKGGWKAKHSESGLKGPVQNSENVPDDAQAGQRVGLTVASVSSREIAFKWSMPN